MALEHVLRGEQNAGPKWAESAPGGCDEAAGAARIEVFPLARRLPRAAAAGRSRADAPLSRGFAAQQRFEA